MSAVVEFTVRADEFRLGRLFADVPDVRVDLTDLVPVGTDRIPYLWVDSDTEGHAAVETTFAAAASVARFRVVAARGTRRLYGVEWAEHADRLFECLAASDVAVDRAVGTGDTWHFRVFSADSANLTTFRRRLDDHGLSISVRRVQDAAAVGDRQPVDLTAEQREALVAALRNGYFAIPRQVTLQDLAAELDISRQAVANRLRRGFATLVEALVVDHSPDRDHPLRLSTGTRG